MTSSTSTLISMIASLVVAVLAPACTSTAEAEIAAMDGDATLTVTLTGIETQSGVIKLALFAGEEGYDGDTPLRGANVEVDEATESVTFEGLAAGAYGIKLYHDVNGNDEMDTNPFGMPTEPFAFSNDARGRFGPASWDKAAFTLEAGENAHAIKVGG